MSGDRITSRFTTGGEANILEPNNGSHHPARASKASMSKTADRVLGVHGFVI
jgi:hypothetical protein